MSMRASFKVSVLEEDRLIFAKLSGDYNPLHIDASYASNTEFKRCVMHGAFSAGLLSRMAGMHLPGVECLLHGMRLRFVKPMIPPIDLEVEGVVLRDDGSNGEVAIRVLDVASGQLLVEGSYQFGRHSSSRRPMGEVPVAMRSNGTGSRVLVTGASGGLGAAIHASLGERCIGVTRGRVDSLVTVEELEMIEMDIHEPLDAIVHCAWPQPNSDSLLSTIDPSRQIEYHLARPLRECLALARLLQSKGNPGAILILVGSSFAEPGRHAWRMPMYSLAKSLIPTLAKILSIELSVTGHRVAAVSFDVIDGGMNIGLSAAVRQSHADRTPSGHLPTMADAASQISWILDNPGILVSGGMIDLSGGAVP